MVRCAAGAQGCAVAQPRAPAGALARHARKPGATRRSTRGRPLVVRRPLPEDHGAGRWLACQTVPMARTYWIDLFTIGTWKEFLDHGGDVSDFEKRRATVQRMKPGDYLLCYLTGVSRWVGVLEVTGEPFFDEAPMLNGRGQRTRRTPLNLVASWAATTDDFEQPTSTAHSQQAERHRSSGPAGAPPTPCRDAQTNTGWYRGPGGTCPFAGVPRAGRGYRCSTSVKMSVSPMPVRAIAVFRPSVHTG